MIRRDPIATNAFRLAYAEEIIELLYTQFMRTDFDDRGEESYE
jgi:hypothetical protein